MVGLVVAGVVACLLGAVLIMLLRHRHNRIKQLADHLSQQAAAQQGLVRHGSGASSNASGEGWWAVQVRLQQAVVAERGCDGLGQHCKSAASLINSQWAIIGSHLAKRHSSSAA